MYKVGKPERFNRKTRLLGQEKETKMSILDTKWAKLGFCISIILQNDARRNQRRHYNNIYYYNNYR